MNPKIFVYQIFIYLALALGVYYNTTWAMEDTPEATKHMEHNPIYAIIWRKGGIPLPQDEQIIKLDSIIRLKALPGEKIPNVIPSLKLFYATLQQNPKPSDLSEALLQALRFLTGL
ncbi:MAG TPA: hypothetical protein VHA52_10580, partial [Candidatus Babeliaceae bacterium]|nr:hypothetical protein [Candidatus Babeliaceae bacterium]